MGYSRFPLSIAFSTISNVVVYDSTCARVTKTGPVVLANQTYRE